MNRINRCQKDGKPAYRWGMDGKCYTYQSGDKVSRERAKRLAMAQGRTIETNKKNSKRKRKRK